MGVRRKRSGHPQALVSGHEAKTVPWMNLAEETAFVRCKKQRAHLKAEGAESVQALRSEVSLQVREAPKGNGGGARRRGTQNL